MRARVRASYSNDWDSTDSSIACNHLTHIEASPHQYLKTGLLPNKHLNMTRQLILVAHDIHFFDRTKHHLLGITKWGFRFLMRL
jgi:hypothetical protein